MISIKLVNSLPSAAVKYTLPETGEQVVMNITAGEEQVGFLSIHLTSWRWFILSLLRTTFLGPKILTRGVNKVGFIIETWYEPQVID